MFDDDPLAAVKDILAVEDIDEIIVSTHPETKSGWLRKNLIDEIRKVAGDRPVEHVVADVAASEGVNVLVVANETVLGDALLDRIRARAKEAPASFLIVCPQSDPARGEHPEAERRLRAALATLRSEGIDVHGQIAHPDPYTAAMKAVSRRADGRDHRLDLPGRALRVAPPRPRRPPPLRHRPSRRARRRTSPIVRRSSRMSSHAEALHEHHGPPAANQSSRVDARTLGMFLFIASEAMLFGSFFAAYFFVRVVNPSAPEHVAAGAVRVPRLRRRREHVHPRDVELHDALGAPVDQARAAGRASSRGWCSRS